MRQMSRLDERISVNTRTSGKSSIHLLTDLVPCEMAYVASSLGRISQTDVWISRDEIVDFLEYEASSKIKSDAGLVK